MDAANLYVPFYRQAHIRVFNEKYKEEGLKALDFAYEDIRNAFISVSYTHLTLPTILRV